MSCCGGKLFDPSRKNGMIECCGTEVYDRSRFQCCNPIIKPPSIKTTTEGCGFGHVDGVVPTKKTNVVEGPVTGSDVRGSDLAGLNSVFRELSGPNSGKNVDESVKTTAKPTTMTLFKYSTEAVAQAGNGKSKGKQSKTDSRKIKQMQKQKRREQKRQKKAKKSKKKRARVDL